jgi:predicted dehydrogenase
LSKAKLRIAVAGAGQIGRRHLEWLASPRLSALAEVVAVVEPAGRLPAGVAGAQAPWYAELGLMLGPARPDGVILATPNAAHAAGALACIKAGIPVLVEKPLADDLQAARDIVDMSERHGVAVLVGHHRRHNALIQAARTLVSAGGLGRVTAISGQCMFRKPDRYFDVEWRRHPGGGPVLINLIHDIDDLRYICGPACGEITAVQAFTAGPVRGYAVEESAAVSLRFENQALASFTVSDNAAAPWSWELTSSENPDYPPTRENCYLIAGTAGALSMPRMTHWSYAEGATPGWATPMQEKRIKVAVRNPLEAQLEHFCEVIRGQAEPLVSAREAALTLEVIDAVARAARSGSSVNLGAVQRGSAAASARAFAMAADARRARPAPAPASGKAP